MSTQERQRSSSPPHFSFDYNCSPVSSWGTAPPSPACKPHKHPILIDHLLYITLPLAEFFLH